MKTNRRQGKLLDLIALGAPETGDRALMLAVLVFCSPDEFAVFVELEQDREWTTAVAIGEPLGFSRSYANQNLNRLCAAGLVERRRSWGNSYEYRLTEAGLFAGDDYDQVYSVQGTAS
jgi:DNA-binding MarR family transcriptional regulator